MRSAYWFLSIVLGEGAGQWAAPHARIVTVEISERHRERAFTLVELLVVIAIIGILAALLLPVASLAENRASQTSCLNNLRQLQIAWHMYVDEYNDSLPLNDSAISAGAPYWSATNSWVIGDAAASADLSSIRDGSIYPYVNATGVYHCPSDHSLVNDTNTLRIRSYSLDYFLNGQLDPQYTQYLPASSFVGLATKDNAIANPSKAFAFADDSEWTIGDGVFLVYRAPSETWEDVPSDRHSQGGNLSFVDGHCEHWRWKASKRDQRLGTSVISDVDGLDLQRLQAALPEAR